MVWRCEWFIQDSINATWLSIAVDKKTVVFIVRLFVCKAVGFKMKACGILLKTPHAFRRMDVVLVLDLCVYLLYGNLYVVLNIAFLNLGVWLLKKVVSFVFLQDVYI